VDGGARADAADAALARGAPAHGVPMTIKDTYETAGMRTTCTSPWSDYHPDDDGPVRRLRDAGAVISARRKPRTLGATGRRQSDLRTPTTL
jgi:amidase